MYLEVSVVSQGWSFLSEAHLQCKRKRCLMMDMCDDLVKFIANELNPKTTICFSFHLRWYSGILFDTHLLHVECGILHYVYQEFRMCSVLVHESRLWNTCWQILYVTVNLSQIDSVLTWPLSDPPLHCLCLNWLDRQIVSFVFVQDIINFIVALVKHIYIYIHLQDQALKQPSSWHFAGINYQIHQSSPQLGSKQPTSAPGPHGHVCPLKNWFIKVRSASFGSAMRGCNGLIASTYMPIDYRSVISMRIHWPTNGARFPSGKEPPQQICQSPQLCSCRVLCIWWTCHGTSL